MGSDSTEVRASCHEKRIQKRVYREMDGERVTVCCEGGKSLAALVMLTQTRDSVGSGS